MIKFNFLKELLLQQVFVKQRLNFKDDKDYVCMYLYTFYPFSVLIYSNNQTDAPKYSFYPTALKGPMVSGWAGRWLGGRKKFVWAVS